MWKGSLDLMNFAIFLTFLRILLVPLLVVMLLSKAPTGDFWALGVLWIAAGTDLLDGYWARRRGTTTTLGTLVDPIADKLLTSAAFISLVAKNLAPVWMVAIILIREYGISGLRSWAATEGFTVAASELGKAKMALQVSCITLIVLGVHVPAVQPVGLVMLWLVIGVTLISAFQYVGSFFGLQPQKFLPRWMNWPLVLRRRSKEDVSIH